MPLLAAKLAPSSSSIAIAKVVSSQPSAMMSPQPRPQQQQSVFSSISSATICAPSQAKRTVGQQQQQKSLSSLSLSSLSSPSEHKVRQQSHQQCQRQQQQIQNQHAFVQQQNQLQTHGADELNNVVPATDCWSTQSNHQHQMQGQHKQQMSNQTTPCAPKNQQSHVPPLNLSGGLEELLTGLDKQQALEKLLQASINTSLAERAAQLQQQQHQSHQNHHQHGHDEDYHNLNLHQLLTSHTIAGDPLQQGGVSLTSLISAASSSSTQVSSSMQDLVGQLAKEFPNQVIKGQIPSGVTVSSSLTSIPSLFQQHSNSSAQSSVYRLGDSQQTAIDVDMDLEIGQLASIANDDVNFRRKIQVNHPPLHNSLKHTPVVCESKSAVLSTSSLSSQQSAIPVSSNVGGRSLPPPPDYNPPPPYHSKPAQSFQAQNPSHSLATGKSSRSSLASNLPTKQTIQNPFTFPTSGVAVHPDMNSHGLQSYSLTRTSVCKSNATSSGNPVSINSDSGIGGPSAASLGASNSSVKQEQFTNFREPMMVAAGNQLYLGGQSKIHSDTLRQKVNVPVVSASSTTQKPHFENKDSERKPHLSYVEHSNREEDLRPMTVQPFNQRISNLSCLPVINSTYRYRSSSVAAQRAR